LECLGDFLTPSLVFTVAVTDDKAYLFGGFSFWEGFPDNYTGASAYLISI
jgi:hypothetical protein